MILGGFVLGVSLAITAFSQNFWQAMGMMFIAGAGSSAFQLLNNSLIMQEADQAYHGRVMSLTMLAWGLNGLVGYPFGLLADSIGERETIFIMAAGVMSVTLLMSVLYAALRGREPAAAQPLPTPAGGD
jgi:MFS family permease